ncbi:MAG: PGF-pre-PGF domain-containing protein, partial [Nanoarchaeota archaeon]
RVSQLFTAIKEGDTAIMKINRSSISFTKLRFTAASSLSNINVDVEIVNESVVSARPLPALKVYQYLSVTTKVTFLDIAAAGVEFRIPKLWLVQNGFKPKEIFLLRYSAGSWDRMVTVLIGEDSSYYYYSAELPGFSVFAVAAEAVPEPVAAAVFFGNETEAQAANITAGEVSNLTVSTPKSDASLLMALLSGPKVRVIALSALAILLLLAVFFC